jgi:hypothetical protein
MPQLRELLALMVLAALGIRFSWTHGYQLFASVFAAEGLAAALSR